MQISLDSKGGVCKRMTRTRKDFFMFKTPNYIHNISFSMKFDSILLHMGWYENTTNGKGSFQLRELYGIDPYIFFEM